MKVKPKTLEQFVWINPRTVTVKEETGSEFGRMSSGEKQMRLGELKQETAEEFWSRLTPETRRRLEEEISSLHES
jgi:hypothetical protein